MFNLFNDHLNLDKSYCIVGLGNIKKIVELITPISSSNVNYVSGTGLLIVTFSTSKKIYEIEELLTNEKKSFILFEMTPGFFSANILDEKIQKQLFGGVVKSKDFFDESEETTNNPEFLDNIKDMLDKINKKNDVVNESLLIEESEPTIDEILDKIKEVGVNNITIAERRILDNFANNN